MAFADCEMDESIRLFPKERLHGNAGVLMTITAFLVPDPFNFPYAPIKAAHGLLKGNKE